MWWWSSWLVAPCFAAGTPKPPPSRASRSFHRHQVLFLNPTKASGPRAVLPSDQLSWSGPRGAECIFSLIDEEPEGGRGRCHRVNVRANAAGELRSAERTESWAWKHPHHDGTVTYNAAFRATCVSFLDVDFGYTPDHRLLLLGGIASRQARTEGGSWRHRRR